MSLVPVNHIEAARDALGALVALMDTHPFGPGYEEQGAAWEQARAVLRELEGAGL